MRSLKRIGVCLTSLVLISGLLISTAAGELALKPEYFTAKDFKFKSGEILAEMKVEYATLGAPRRDASGAITNAVIFCHGYSGDYSQIKLLTGAVGPGLPFDTDKYFFICPSALGSPGSSSPSVSGLGPKFPKYGLADMIEAQYRLVSEHFKIKHLAGVAGASMGGMQTLQWITDYPEFMDWAIPIASSHEFKGRNVGVFGLMSHVIRNDPAYLDGAYKEQPKKGLEHAFMGVYLWYFTPTFYKAKYKTNQELLDGLKNIGLGSAKMDANDIVWRNDAMLSYNLTGRLDQVKARTLIIGVNTDELFPPDAEFGVTAKLIPGAKVFAYDSVLGHMGCALEIKKANQAIADFLK